MEVLDTIWEYLLSYGPLGLVVGLALVAIIVLGRVIIYLDQQRTSEAAKRVTEFHEERMFYQNHFFTSMTQITALMQKHEERAQERHNAQMENHHRIALALERIMERTEQR